MTHAFVFPGQGSQFIGMGQELAQASAAARAVFEEVDTALQQDLSGLMFAGDADTLTLTENAQPALMAVSLAAVRALEERAGRDLSTIASHVAGHSLGEYSALAAAGGLSVGDTARLLRLRGQAMQKAVPVGEGAMAALLGLDLEAAREVAAEAAQGQICFTANDNAPGQVVVSGHRAAVERAIAIAAGKGARRGVLLPVSAPFHCPLMAAAGSVMAEALAQVTLQPPRVPLVPNVSAEATSDPVVIRRLLSEQVTGMVRWRESVLHLRDQGATVLVETGAGKVLSGLTKRIDKSLTSATLGTPAEIDTFVAATLEG